MTGKSNERRAAYYPALFSWISRLLEEDGLGKAMEERGIHTFSVYGIGQVGDLLLRQLHKENRLPEYIVEKDTLGIKDYHASVIPVEEIGDQRDVDALIIVAVHLYDELEMMARSYGFRGRIMSLTEFLEEEIA